MHAAAAASHSESHPDRTGKLPQQADHARQGLVVQSSTRGLAVPRAPCDAMPRRAAAAPTSESAGPPPAWTGRRLPGPGRHALAGAPSPQGAMPPLAQRAPTRSLRAGRRRRPARRWRTAAAPGGGSGDGDGRQGRERAFRRISRNGAKLRACLRWSLLQSGHALPSRGGGGGVHHNAAVGGPPTLGPKAGVRHCNRWPQGCMQRPSKTRSQWHAPPPAPCPCTPPAAARAHRSRPAGADCWIYGALMLGRGPGRALGRRRCRGSRCRRDCLQAHSPARKPFSGTTCRWAKRGAHRRRSPPVPRTPLGHAGPPRGESLPPTPGHGAAAKSPHPGRRQPQPCAVRRSAPHPDTPPSVPAPAQASRPTPAPRCRASTPHPPGRTA